MVKGSLDFRLVMTQQRPIITIPKSRQEVVLDGIAIAGLIILLATAIYAWSILPEIIPVHFNWVGQPDGWGNKAMIWIFPIVGVCVYVGFTFLRRYPHTFNYPVAINQQNARRQYEIARSLLNWLKAELMWMQAYIVWMILYAATSQRTDLSWLLLPVVIVTIFSTVGFYLRQAYLAR